MIYDIDLHVHSVASEHAYSTIEEIAKKASKKGIKAFALTDHGPNAPDAPYRYYFSNLRVIPKYIDGVRIYKGVEANIISDAGDLDLNDNDLNKLDIVLAAFHNKTGYNNNTYENNTKSIINAIKTGKIDVLAHMGHPKFQLDYEQAIKTAKEYNTAIEINNSSFTGSRKGGEENCHKIIQLAKEYGCYLSLGSDSHISFSVGELTESVKLIEKYNYNKDLIINQNIDFLDLFLQSRKRR